MHRLTRRITATLPILLWMLVAYAADSFAAQTSQTLAITFTANAVIVTGALPGQPVYLLGIARVPLGYATRVQYYEARLQDASAAGQVTYPYDPKLSWRSVWLAVDLTSGAYKVASPPSYPIAKSIPLGDKHLKKAFGSEVEQLAFEGALVDFLVVRPSKNSDGGVWSNVVGLHGPIDESHDRHLVTISVGNLKKNKDTADPAPKKLKNGDIVFVLNSFAARYGVAEVGQ